MFFLMDRNRGLPDLKRIFIEPSLAIGKFQDMHVCRYTPSKPDVPHRDTW
jgi:hypothetical protein